MFPSVISTLIAILLGFFTSRLSENIISNTETTKRLGYLHMEMDPEKFISSYIDIPKKTTGDKEKMISYAYLSSGYEAAGDSLEITLIDYGFTNDTTQFVTEIQIPVK